MYDRSGWYGTLVAQIQKQDVYGLLKDKYALLLQIELGLRLIERLALFDEPITVLWVLLSDNPIPDARLHALASNNGMRSPTHVYWSHFLAVSIGKTHSETMQ